MPIYWSFRSIPEVAMLPAKRRKEIWREYFEPLPRAFPYLFTALRVLSFPAILLITREIWWVILIWGLWNVLLQFIELQVKISRVLPEIRERMGGLCPYCGYDIRATPQRCPECGQLCQNEELISA